MLQKYKDQLLIVLLGSILYIPFLGAAHLFDWDEINFAEAAREMIVSGNYLQVQINFQPFWEKPPLFFWMQVLSMKLFGINEFGARLPNALCGIITLLVVFSTGKRIADRKMGWIWLMCFGGSLLPLTYFKSGIIDPWFNLFIFLSLAGFIRYQNEKALRFIFQAGLFSGLAILTKGPVAVLVAGLCVLVFFIINRFRNFPSFRSIVLLLFSVVLPLLPWLGIEIARNGTWFIWEFTKYQFELASSDVAGHKGFPGYHFVVVFFFCIPAAVFALPSFRKSDSTVNNFRQWMLILFWVVILLFSLVETKIIHYSSLTYLPLSFLAAHTIYNLSGKWKPWLSVILIISFLPLLASIFFLQYASKNPQIIFPNVDLDTTVINDPLQGYEFIYPVMLLLLLFMVIMMNSRNRTLRAVIVLFTGCTLIFNLMIADLAPKVEAISQRPMINSLKKYGAEDVYLTVTGFKSYAHLFYGGVQPSDVNNQVFTGWLERRRKELNQPADWPSPTEFQHQYNLWLLQGSIDKPAYFIIRSNAVESMLGRYTDLSLVQSEGGFSVLKREAMEGR